ncbi:hypothetical protein GCM10011512_05200 [Tersicoccus solisilvae]|uniref:HAD family hydrolase n=1 Tax=Tersicoccus solisilvae TaxID=1882339 RepID=A0ABQ1NRZ5_9MICC|nr:HAD family hydrolase [Tersicoccus solisilvae]GGC81475.1 hypothetical protein GCM10011512_05200 [Tersicoccus solisilvae]
MGQAQGLVAVDLDGTLVNQAAAACRWAQEFVCEFGIDADIEETARALAQPRPKGPVFSELVERFDLPLSAEALWARYRRRMPYLVTCEPEDRTALDRLRAAGWAVGILTNGMSDNQEAKIRVLGLDAHIDGWVVSDDVGVRKPERAIFEALATRLNRRLTGWMIGDGLEHDIVGGHRAGLRTAYINRSGSAAASPAPDLIVASVSEAVDAILTGASAGA